MGRATPTGVLRHCVFPIVCLICRRETSLWCPSGYQCINDVQFVHCSFDRNVVGVDIMPEFRKREEPELVSPKRSYVQQFDTVRTHMRKIVPAGWTGTRHQGLIIRTASAIGISTMHALSLPIEENTEFLPTFPTRTDIGWGRRWGWWSTEKRYSLTTRRSHRFATLTIRRLFVYPSDLAETSYIGSTASDGGGKITTWSETHLLQLCAWLYRIMSGGLLRLVQRNTFSRTFTGKNRPHNYQRSRVHCASTWNNILGGVTLLCYITDQSHRASEMSHGFQALS